MNIMKKLCMNFKNVFAPKNTHTFDSFFSWIFKSPLMLAQQIPLEELLRNRQTSEVWNKLYKCLLMKVGDTPPFF